MMDRTLGLFVRFPERGRVKTRLAAEIGDERACALYAAFVCDLVKRFRSIGTRRVLAFTPEKPDARPFFESLGGGDFDLWPQPEGTLGLRISAFFGSFSAGPTVLVGSDSPTLPASLVSSVFDRLAATDCVLGPAVDGGVYLIGLRNNCSISAGFEEVDWSTSRVLEQLTEHVLRSGRTLEFLPLWYDIDTWRDVQFLRGHLKVLERTEPEVWAGVVQTKQALDVLGSCGAL